MCVCVCVLSWCTGSTDFPDPLKPLASIVHYSRLVFLATSCISTELLSRMSCSSNLDGFRHGFVRWEISRCTASVLWDVASMICSVQLVALLFNCCQAFFLYALSASMWCMNIVLLTQTLLGKKLRFLLSDWPDFYMNDRLSITVHTFTSFVLMSFSVAETLLPK